MKPKEPILSICHCTNVSCVLIARVFVYGECPGTEGPLITNFDAMIDPRSDTAGLNVMWWMNDKPFIIRTGILTCLSSSVDKIQRIPKKPGDHSQTSAKCHQLPNKLSAIYWLLQNLKTRLSTWLYNRVSILSLSQKVTEDGLVSNSPSR